MALAGCGRDEPVDASTPGTEAGQRMYREGILASGEPMRAIVGGGVPIIGTQFSCVSCHGRSGMGAAEGAYVIPPIAGQFLYTKSPQPKRPAYDDASLARLLREGITPSGRQLSPELMPRYQVSDEDVANLSAYLETLSAGNSPGVYDDVIRFATVVTDGVDPGERDAVFEVLERFAEEINRQTRLESERWDRGYTPESRLPTVFRDWVIDEWRLNGPRETWPAQLERYYEEAPVFAMLSGLGSGSWRPVAEFCEREQVPCLFPSADLPYAAAGDFYTFYFSRGLLLEADLIGSHIGANPVDHVVQVYCNADMAAAAAGLHRALAGSTAAVENLTFDCADGPPETRLAEVAGSTDTAVVLWVTREELAGQPLPDGRYYLSSSLLEGKPVEMTPGGAGTVFMAHPFRLPEANDPAMRRFDLWAHTRDIEITERRLQAEAFFACLALNDAVKHMGRFFIREFTLDMLDHAQGIAAYLPVYPRPTLGPGQRFLNKGGYVLPVQDDAISGQDAEWILP